MSAPDPASDEDYETIIASVSETATQERVTNRPSALSPRKSAEERLSTPILPAPSESPETPASESPETPPSESPGVGLQNSSASRTPSSAPSTLSPTLFGRYQLHRTIATGGMGVVHLATDYSEAARVIRFVALKQVHPHMVGETLGGMFLDEIRIAARINHPNVVSILDFGEEQGVPYYTMPLVLGVRLSDLTKAMSGSEELKTLWCSILSHCVRDACRGLHAAHELRDDDDTLLGVVHRDVSPQNLIVGFDGTTLVLDFGVATAMDRMHHTATGEFKGRLAYAAPERLAAKAVDRRADVWSLGVILWEAIAGARLFPRNPISETLRAVLEKPIPRLIDVAPHVPEVLSAIVEKSLSRDVDERFSSCRAMERALSKFLTVPARSADTIDVSTLVENRFPGRSRSKRKLLARIRRRISENGAETIAVSTEFDTRMAYSGEDDLAEGSGNSSDVLGSGIRTSNKANVPSDESMSRNTDLKSASIQDLSSYPSWLQSAKSPETKLISQTRKFRIAPKFLRFFVFALVLTATIVAGFLFGTFA